MKDFFKKIWDSIKAFAKKTWDWTKNLVNKAWAWVKGLLKSVPYKKLYLFIAGMILAAIAYINFHIVGCIAAPAFLFFAICFFQLFTKDKTDWWNFGAATIGGAIIQLMVFFV